MKTVSRVQETPATTKRAAIVLWLSVAGAFLLLVAAWFAMFTAARSAGVQSVPLAPVGRNGS